jgi:hypothetical protein
VKCRTHGPAGDLGQVLLRREAGPASEQPVEVELGQADVFCDLRQPGLAAVFAFDEFDGARHARELAAVDECV